MLVQNMASLAAAMVGAMEKNIEKKTNTQNFMKRPNITYLENQFFHHFYHRHFWAESWTEKFTKNHNLLYFKIQNNQPLQKPQVLDAQSSSYIFVLLLMLRLLLM